MRIFEWSYEINLHHFTQKRLYIEWITATIHQVCWLCLPPSVLSLWWSDTEAAWRAGWPQQVWAGWEGTWSLYMEYTWQDKTRLDLGGFRRRKQPLKDNYPARTTGLHQGSGSGHLKDRTGCGNWPANYRSDLLSHWVFFKACCQFLDLHPNFQAATGFCMLWKSISGALTIQLLFLFKLCYHHVTVHLWIQIVLTWRCAGAFRCFTNAKKKTTSHVYFPRLLFFVSSEFGFQKTFPREGFSAAKSQISNVRVSDTKLECMNNQIFSQQSTLTVHEVNVHSYHPSQATSSL